jgi:hypothetical protein
LAACSWSCLALPSSLCHGASEWLEIDLCGLATHGLLSLLSVYLVLCSVGEDLELRCRLDPVDVINYMFYFSLNCVTSWNASRSTKTW